MNDNTENKKSLNDDSKSLNDDSKSDTESKLDADGEEKVSVGLEQVERRRQWAEEKMKSMPAEGFFVPSRTFTMKKVQSIYQDVRNRLVGTLPGYATWRKTTQKEGIVPIVSTNDPTKYNQIKITTQHIVATCDFEGDNVIFDDDHLDTEHLVTVLTKSILAYLKPQMLDKILNNVHIIQMDPTQTENPDVIRLKTTLFKFPRAYRARANFYIHPDLNEWLMDVKDENGNWMVEREDINADKVPLKLFHHDIVQGEKTDPLHFFIADIQQCFNIFEGYTYDMVPRFELNVVDKNRLQAVFCMGMDMVQPLAFLNYPKISLAESPVKTP